MKTSQANDDLKRKSVSELISVLKEGQSGQGKIDPDYLDSIIAELNSRRLSKEEKNEFENLMKFYFEENIDNTYQSSKETPPIKDYQFEYLKDEMKRKMNKEEEKNSSNDKYLALITIIRLLSILAYIVVVIGVIIFFYLASQGNTAMGFAAIIVSVVLALPILAFSNLIQVFIDTENNTHMTYEILKKIYSKK